VGHEEIGQPVGICLKRGQPKDSPELTPRRAQTVIVAPTNSTLKASHHTSAV
jgi:hypothetical protein